MGLKDEVAVLSTIPLFAAFEPAKLKLLAFTSERVTFAADQDLCVQGEMGDCAFVILSGNAKVIVETANGRITVTTLGSNSIVGEISILTDVPRTATVRASGEVVTLKITKSLFFQMMNEFPGIAIEVTRELARRLQNTTAQLGEMQSRLPVVTKPKN